jgi:hypothetical protein
VNKVKLDDPVRYPGFGWFVPVEIGDGYLNKDGEIYETTRRNSDENHIYLKAWEDPNSGYWGTYDLAMNAKKKYENAVKQPEPQLAAYELEGPVRHPEMNLWSVYAKDTGYYSYALTEDLELRHPALRHLWETYQAALFAKLSYERKVKHLQQQKG